MSWLSPVRLLIITVILAVVLIELSAAKRGQHQSKGGKSNKKGHASLGGGKSSPKAKSSHHKDDTDKEKNGKSKNHKDNHASLGGGKYSPKAQSSYHKDDKDNEKHDKSKHHKDHSKSVHSKHSKSSSSFSHKKHDSDVRKGRHHDDGGSRRKSKDGGKSSSSSSSSSSWSKSKKEKKMKQDVLEDLMKARGKGSHGSKGRPRHRFPNPYTQCQPNIAILCENQGKMKLKCPSGSVIRVIDSNFGRTQSDNEVCPTNRNHMDDTNCYSPAAKGIVQCRCNNMKMCVLIADSKYFGDPCRHTYKYLEVEYVCVVHKKLNGLKRKANRGKGRGKPHSEERCVPPCPSHCGMEEQCLLEEHHDGSLSTKCGCQQSNLKCGACKDQAGLTCSASGDPHYKTFDGKMIHFQGTCRYLLSGTIENTTETEFQVLVENEHRNGKTRVSYTKTVTVLVYGHQVILRQGGVVLVDSVVVALPYSGIPNVLIEFDGRRTVTLETEFGLRVTFDGRHAVSVTLPDNYCSEVEGICGNMNGDQPDDCVTKDGEDVSGDSDMYSKIGNSWKVYSDDIQSCKDPVTDIEVPDEIPDECKILVKDPDSPLFQCIDELPHAAKSFLEDCSYDCGEVGDNDQHRHEAACDVIESFVDFCEDVLGTVVRDWRDDANCPVICPDGFEHSESASGCPATCEDPQAPESCDLPEREACVCEGGTVLQGEECVEIEQCGCVDGSGNYHKQGEVWLSEDCSVEYRCDQLLITSTTHVCEEDQYCGVLDGTRQCIDEDPFPDNPCDEGEGYLKCLTCTNATSDYDCQRYGEWVTCEGDDAICLEEITSVPFSSRHVQITRRCISKPQCRAIIHQQGGVCSRRCRLSLCRSCDYDHSQCAVDCVWGPWNAIGGCSKTCGAGTQTFRRMPNAPRSNNGGKPCRGGFVKQEPCFLKECPEDGDWCDFGDWYPCSKRCGPGRQVRRRECKCPEPDSGGRPCRGFPLEIRPCVGTECPVDGDWSEWSEFGDCQGVCGIGVKQRTRTCTDPPPSLNPPGGDCVGRDWDVMKCTLEPCLQPVNGSWSPWSNFGPCSVNCGLGSKTRRRQCNDPAPQDGGENCVGNDTDAAPCFAGPCPINEPYPCDEGSYLQCLSCQNQPSEAACAASGEWKSCNGPDQICTKRVVTARGVERVFRACTSRRACKAQQRNGVCFELRGIKSCVTCSYGESDEEHRCAVDGGWCDYGEFGDCSAACGRGVKTQSRNCTCPAPESGGRDCVGRTIRPMVCDAGCCPVDGGWGPWRDWSPCNVTCGVGKQVSIRPCNQPSPDCGGAPCQEDSEGGTMKIRDCDAGHCPDKDPNPCESDGRPRSVLQCWTCDGQSSEANCASNGYFETCSQNDPICITHVTFNSPSSRSISRSCEERSTCYRTQEDNGAVCSISGGVRKCVLCNYRMSRCVEPPCYPCPNDTKLWCFTCEGSSVDECRNNGSFQLCSGMEQDMCYYRKVVDSFGAVTSVSHGCKPRSECQATDADMSEVCEDNSGEVSCVRCGFKPGRFKCNKDSSHVQRLSKLGKALAMDAWNWQSHKML